MSEKHIEGLVNLQLFVPVNLKRNSTLHFVQLHEWLVFDCRLETAVASIKKLFQGHNIALCPRLGAMTISHLQFYCALSILSLVGMI